MFYEELYTELGKLFYYLASADGKVRQEERQSLLQLIHNTWEPLEDSPDKYGTDEANIIDFSFDYEEEEGFRENEFESFETFYHANHSKFTPAIIRNILKTCEAISSAYQAKNKTEQVVLDKITKLLK